MTEFKHDANDLEQRLRYHYQRRYEQPPDSTQIWARVQPQLDRQEHSQPGLLQQVKWLPGVIGRLAARQRAALKATYQEHTYMDEKIHEEAIHIDQAEAHDPRFTHTSKPSLRRRLQHLTESGIAAVLVASLLLSWFVITNARSNRGTAASLLLSYTSQPGERIQSSAGWTPDGHHLTFIACKAIPADNSCSFQVLDTTAGKVEQTFSWKASSYGVSMSSDRRYAFVMVWDSVQGAGTASLVNILTGQVQQIYQGNYHQSFVQGSFSHDNKSLAVFTGKDLQIWDVATGHIRFVSDPNLIRIPGGDPTTSRTVLQVNWSLDDKRIALEVFPELSANGLQIWDARTGHRLTTIVETPDMALSLLAPDMKRILTYNQQQKTFAVRDVSTLKVLRAFPGQLNPPDTVAVPAWLDGGARLLLQQNQQAIIWNTTTGQRIASCPLVDIQGLEGPSVVSNNGEGHYIACLQQDNQLDILDSLTGSTVNVFPLKTHPLVFAWLLDGKYILVMDRDNRFDGQVYNALTGQLVLSYTGTISQSHDGNYLAVVSVPADGSFDSTTTIQIFALH